MQRRNTNQRKLIYEVLKNTNIHPTADWIYEQVRKEISNISLGTVYRNLKVLKEEGKILEINDGKQSRFDARTDKHFHFKCTSCAGIYDIDKEGIIEINDAKLAQMGYFVQDLDVVFVGICYKCKTGEN
ncbi:MAG: transcriptional repressor [Aquificae bacterium]|nr:transcriptional repressor [Aquificota bacterium]